MAEVQDEDKWLYGDDPNAEAKEAKKKSPEPEEDKTDETNEAPPDKDTNVPESTDTEANGDVNETNAEDKDAEPAAEDDEAAEKNGEKAKDGNDDDSSSDDEPTVTIGKIVKQPDIMRPPPPTHRAAPTSGLKDEDFASAGKINGVPATDYNLAELEEKPWRKPGADLSDYFNYGFTEDTWIKYCERQKAMRTNESGIGLNSLGINVSNRMMSSALPSNIPVSIVNENSKYASLRKPAGMPVLKKSGEDDSSNMNQANTVNTIQVMTADRRTYSNKVLSGAQGGTYEEVDFGGNPYGNDFFSTPPPNFYNPPPPTAPWGGIPNVPPPGWNPDGGIGAPPPVSLHRGGMGYFEEDSMGGFGRPSRSAKEEREMEKIRESIVESRDRGERESRHHRRRSRSRSKSRHKRRSKSRSRSPSHKHKRKKSKRERETE